MSWLGKTAQRYCMKRPRQTRSLGVTRLPSESAWPWIPCAASLERLLSDLSDAVGLVQDDLSVFLAQVADQ